MRLFPARYNGTCANMSDCFGEFEEGDLIGYNEDDELCCQACLMNARDQIDDTPSAKNWGSEIEGYGK